MGSWGCLVDEMRGGQGRMVGAAMTLMMAVVVMKLGVSVDGRRTHGWGAWVGNAHATYYGGSDASGTNDGACGYGNQISQYGVMTTALSTPLFKAGQVCGACYKVRCWRDAGCLAGRPELIVTVTNLCPPGSYGGWCDPPKSHFDLSQPAFSHIAKVPFGHVPIIYRRVSCRRSGGVHFTINGHTFFNLVLVTNVGGAGDVVSVAIKGSSTGWMQMKRNWGQNWENGANLDGQSLSFQITTSDGRTITSFNTVPQYWNFGQTFAGRQF
ncbi:hypothetical protein GOP47_0022611 [Adiantum capillus-veneris]|uniref:Expansin n=1 Tax=Adiantum capillus-veneris TaxID=13818 RepID=A0A9D4U643_ADICA|nr:hypothetical protein GOP47_0022611 [Adiantum capillus-veneris]